jgi:hypothetical protein
MWFDLRSVLSRRSGAMYVSQPKMGFTPWALAFW